MARTRHPGRIQEQRQKQGPPPQRGKEPLESRASGHHDAQGPRPPRAGRKKNKKSDRNGETTSTLVEGAAGQSRSVTTVYLVGVLLVLMTILVVAAARGLGLVPARRGTHGRSPWA